MRYHIKNRPSERKVMNMTNWRMTGIASGIIIGLLICIVLFKFFNKDGKMTTKYDEMQEIIRGKAYKYGFWTFCICEGICAVLSTSENPLPINGFSLHFLTIIIGVMVQVTYSIWNGAYIGLNTNTGRFAAVSIVISLVNFAAAFAAISRGEMYQNGQLQDSFMNLLCAVMFIIIGIELLIKRVWDNTAKED